MPHHGATPLPPPDAPPSITLLGALDNLDTLRRKNDGKALSAQPLLLHLLSRLPLRRVLDRLLGNYALIIRQPGRVQLVSDPLGSVPLFWQRAGARLRWSTHLPPGPVDPIAVRQFLMVGYVLAPRTLRRATHRLPPGHLLTADHHGVRLERWWRPEPILGGSGGSLLKWADSTAGAIQVAVRRQLPEAPCGFWLEDTPGSAAITIVGRQQRGTQALQTVSRTSPPALSARLNPRHTTAPMDPDLLSAALMDLTAPDHAPLGRWSAVEAWQIGRQLNRLGLTVGLTGHGAEVLFAGRGVYRRHRRHVALGRIPLAGRLQRAIPWPRRHLRWTGLWAPEDVMARDDDLHDFDRHGQNAVRGESSDAVSLAIGLDLRTHVPEVLLAGLYRAGEAHNVHLRAPMLSPRMVSMTAEMPTEMKLGLRQGERVLRRAINTWLPDIRFPSVSPSPLAALLKSDGQRWLRTLRPERVRIGALRTALRRLHRGDHHAAERLWALIVLERWLAQPQSPDSQADAPVNAARTRP